jgi:hypothetical protein
LLGKQEPEPLISSTSPHSSIVQSVPSESEKCESEGESSASIYPNELNESSSTDDDDDVLTMGGHLKSLATEKDNHNVPFPCLCGASFSPSGQLTYFLSPLPHPSSTKFTSYTLSTKNQHPILQSQGFSTQPKTYALYENYRSFVLARCPRMFLGGIPTLHDRITMGDDNIIKDKKLDYWLDDEEIEDEPPGLYWKPKAQFF